MKTYKTALCAALCVATLGAAPQAKAQDLFGALVEGAMNAATAQQQDKAQQADKKEEAKQQPATGAAAALAPAAAGLISESIRTGTNPGDILKYQAQGSAEAMKYDARNSGANLINNLLTAPPQ